MKILAIYKVAFRQCLGYRVVYLVFITAILFILLGRSCSPGELTGNDIFFDAQSRHDLVMNIAFNGIVLWSIMLCGLLSANVLSKDLDEGTAVITLSRPVSRACFAAGKLLSCVAVSVLNLFLLGIVFASLFFLDAGVVRSGIFIGFAVISVNIIMYAMMSMLFSLMLPGILTPLLCFFIYLMSCWAALPFHYEKLRLLWIPSATTIGIHQYLPPFGDLQFAAASFTGTTEGFNDLTALFLRAVVYCLLLWGFLLLVFRRKELG